MKFTKIDEATQSLCHRIGAAKAEYLSARGHLNSLRGLYGTAKAQWKKADRIVRLRPTSKGGDQPTYTAGQMARAERKYATTLCMVGNLDCDIETAKLEMRHRLLAYGFLRGRSYGQMESNLNQFTPRPDAAKIALYAGSELAVIKYWIEHPDAKPSAMNKAVFEAEAKIRDLKHKTLTAEAEVTKIQNTATEYGRRLRSVQASIADLSKSEKDTQEKAEKKAEEAKNLRAKLRAAEAELLAAKDPTNKGVAA